jgi:hypothetical protein
MLTAAVRTLRGGALARVGTAGGGASGWMSRLGDAGVALQGQLHTHTLRGATAVEATMRPAWGRGFTASTARLGAEEFFTPFFDRMVTPENEKEMLVGTYPCPYQSNSRPALPPHHRSGSTHNIYTMPAASAIRARGKGAGENALSTEPQRCGSLCCRQSVGVQTP